jgi:UDP-3-O-[3-hydroxymyristoyl] N-acetylglucosamine deacetylase
MRPWRGARDHPLFVKDDGLLRMVSLRKQQTIAGKAAVEGIGYWTGRDVRVEFRPAPPETGIIFVREDLPSRPQIPASVDHCTDIPLRTNLRCGVAGVDMIEHVMAALAGLRVDNCFVHVDEQEMPGCDGSSLPFVEALLGAGIVPQGADRRAWLVREPIRLGGDDAWIEARPCCSREPVLQYELDYGPGYPIGRQKREVILSPEVFCEELAGSRTFLLQEEALALKSRGLGRRATCRDLLVFGPGGPVDNALRFPDECVRHKLLDMVGDLALAGCDLVGRIVACRSGHRMNIELVRAILAAASVPQRLRRCA